MDQVRAFRVAPSRPRFVHLSMRSAEADDFGPLEARRVHAARDNKSSQRTHEEAPPTPCDGLVDQSDIAACGSWLHRDSLLFFNCARGQLAPSQPLIPCGAWS
jgi:hypothetical protein